MSLKIQDHGESLVQAFLETKKTPLIVILGPTASGKTNFSLTLSKFIFESFGKKVEIVNADSRQCYKDLDIGTAKVTKEEMGDIAHHLFSVLDPKQEANIGWYQEQALRVIREIHARGNVPILVGGSMLYISSVIDGLKPLPIRNEELRKKLDSAYDADGGKRLYEELQSVDPESARIIPRENKVYVLRALELYHTLGIPKSKLKQRGECPFNLLMLGLSIDRELLYTRINARVKQMLKAGWTQEVRQLKALGYTSDDPGFFSHGYREIFECLEQEKDPMTMADAIALQTRHYAKRQLTWWRRDERIQWITS